MLTFIWIYYRHIISQCGHPFIHTHTHTHTLNRFKNMHTHTTPDIHTLKRFRVQKAFLFFQPEEALCQSALTFMVSLASAFSAACVCVFVCMTGGHSGL